MEGVAISSLTEEDQVKAANELSYITICCIRQRKRSSWWNDCTFLHEERSVGHLF